MSKGSGNQDQTEVIIILAGIAIFALSFLYNKYFYVIADIWRYIRILEFSIFAWIPKWVPIFGDLDFNGTIEYLKSNSGENLSKEFVSKVDIYYGRYLSWIPAVILIFLGFRLVAKTDNVSRVFDMETLLKDRAPNYPFIQKFVEVHPEKMDIYYERGSKKSSDYSIAMSPKYFAEMKPPLGLEKMARKNKELRKQSIWDGHTGFDWDLAERAFKAQLGKRYEGLSSLNETEAKLYWELNKKIKTGVSTATPFIQGCIKAAIKNVNLKGLSDTESQIYEKIKEFYKLATKKNVKSNGYYLKKDFVRSIFEDKEMYPLFINRHCEQVMAKHAYIRTGLMSLLLEARNAGVVASLEFRHWLKGDDRTLWYCISSVGRKVSFVECGGVFAHWLLEKELSRPITQIFVDEAIEALKEALRIEDRIKLEEDNNRNAGF